MGGPLDNLFGEKSDLSLIKNQLNKQESWLIQLHKFSNDLHNYTKYIKESNMQHKREVLEQINSLVKWVDHFNDSHIQLKNEINELKTGLRKLLRKDFEIYHNTIMEYLDIKLEKHKEQGKAINERLDEFSSLFETQPVINEDNEKDVKNIMHYNIENELTNPEKDLLNLMFNENKPMTYEYLARKSGKSVSSIRVYMNSLRSKKGIIDEFKTGAGKKIFSVKNSELVKTLFNVN